MKQALAIAAVFVLVVAVVALSIAPAAAMGSIPGKCYNVEDSPVFIVSSGLRTVDTDTSADYWIHGLLTYRNASARTITDVVVMFNFYGDDGSRIAQEWGTPADLRENMPAGITHSNYDVLFHDGSRATMQGQFGYGNFGQLINIWGGELASYRCYIGAVHFSDGGMWSIPDHSAQAVDSQ